MATSVDGEVLGRNGAVDDVDDSASKLPGQCVRGVGEGLGNKTMRQWRREMVWNDGNLRVDLARALASSLLASLTGSERG